MKKTNQSIVAQSPRAHFVESIARLESLESRRMLSTVHATTSDGILHITGTDSNDNIQLTVEKGHILTLKAGGLTKTFGRTDSNGIDHTEIMLLGGNDRVTVGAGAGNVYVNGGSGNDTLTGGDGNDTLNGAGGTDVIFGDGGRDLIKGGAGNDQLRGGR